jgi:hypothetical protein
MVGTRVGRRAGLAALIAVVGLVVEACGGGGSPLQRSSSPTSVTTASNHQLAVAETARLLTRVQVPPGSTKADSPGSDLLDSVWNGTFAAATDGRRYWRVHEAYTVAIAWIDAHAPRGSKPGDSTRTQGSTVRSTVGGYTYLPPSTAAWQNIQLSVEATAVGPDVTAVRADAQVQWVDPTPYPDHTTGRRLHLDARSTCPAGLAPYTDVGNTGPGLRTALVPPGRIISVLVCRYGSPERSSRPDRGLTLSRRLNHRAVAYLVTKARKVQLGHPTAEPPPACAGGPSSTVVIVAFGYSSRRSVDLWVEPTSCPSNEDNGTVEVPLDGTVYAALQLTVPGIGSDG